MDDLPQDLAPTPREPAELGALCPDCLFDAGYRCGMTGADGCALLERWLEGIRPVQWSLGATGASRCSGYEPGLALN